MMLHAKLQSHRTSDSGEERFCYSPCGHLGHVIWTIPVPKDVPHEIWLGLV